jgi:hypothetical protein
MTTLRTTLTHTTLELTASERRAVLALIPARHTYKRDFARGYYRVSGADLTGKAGDYRAKYHGSRLSVLALCKIAGIPLVSVTGHRGATSVWSVAALADHYNVN